MGWLRRAPIESTIIVVTAIILAMALVLTIDLNLAKLEKAVYIDPLTKAFNRRYFMEVAAATLVACTKVEREFALIMLDIDHFKRINDTYGHLVGDEVLKTTFARISHSLAGDTVIARIGGEEFVVLVTDAEKADVIGIAQRIQKNLSATMFHIGDVIIAVTASFGIASRNPGNISLEKILENSDTALYRAKASGRNAIVHFDGNL
jgi:two-component system cell cycle response regulator